MSYTSAVITERISWYSCNCLSIADGWYLDCWTVNWYWRKIQFKNDFVFTGCKREHIQTYTTAVIPFAWIEMKFHLICLCFDLAKIFICNLDTCFIASSVINTLKLKKLILIRHQFWRITFFKWLLYETLNIFIRVVPIGYCYHCPIGSRIIFVFQCIIIVNLCNIIPTLTHIDKVNSKIII